MVESYQGIFVFMEPGRGVPARVSLELLCKGRSLADTLGVAVTAVLIGEGVEPQADGLIPYGADQVIIVDDPVAREYRTEVYAEILAAQLRERRAEALLVGATCVGRDLAPRVAARLNTGCTADCTDLDVEPETRLIVATKPFLGRNLMAEIVCPGRRPQIMTVRPGVMPLEAPAQGRKGDLIRLGAKIREEDVKVKVLHTERSASGGGRDLQEAHKVVGGGMGVGDEAGFEMLRELSDLLGAELGATTLPIDEGWISEDRKIGQTGKTIAPRLYLACGISGAVQHTVGITRSELIVAINRDPKATIFDFAHYGIVDDLHKVVPALIAELKALKG